MKNTIKKINTLEDLDLGIILENSFDGIYITDGESRSLYINSAWERISGIARSDVLGKTSDYLLANKIIDRSITLDAISQKKPLSVIQQFKTGKQALVTSNPILDPESGDVQYVIINVRDITELTQLKDTLHEQTLLNNHNISELNKLKALYENPGGIICKSKKMHDVLTLAYTAAQSDSNILLTGESGAGKGVLAKFIHDNSPRKNMPYVAVNCAGIPGELFESELFGYNAGAFSGAAAKGKKGILETADNGTAFLDEIGDLSPAMQVKILHAVEEKTYNRLGSALMQKLNIRIITATNQNLSSMIAENKFRQDLFYRISSILIHIPPLRERPEDIAALSGHFTAEHNKLRHSDKVLSTEALKLLLAYSYPGNVRELAGIIEQTFLLSRNTVIQTEDLPLSVRNFLQTESAVDCKTEDAHKKHMQKIECDALKAAVKKYGSTRKAARHIGISQSSIVRKLKKSNS